MAGEVIMAIYKGLIFSLDKRSAVVATPQNAIYKINRTSTMYIGKEIVFSDKDIINYRYYIKRYSVAAACFCLIIGVAISFILNSNKNFSTMKEYAYISMDINPSVEFTIDKGQKVLKVDPLNNDADQILAGENLIGMKLIDAFSKLYEICKDRAIIVDDKVFVLVSGTVNPNSKEYKKEGQIKDNSIENILVELKESIQKTSDSKADIIVLESMPETRKQAIEEGVSPSKYALYSEIRRKGGEISIEEIKNSSTDKLIKIYNEINKEEDSSAETVFNPEPTFDLDNVFASPTPDLTLTPLVTETPTALKTEGVKSSPTPALAVPVCTQNIPTNAPRPTPVAKPTEIPKPTPTKVNPGTGLRGDYFDNIDLTNFKLTRVDKAINFYWGVNPPALEIRDDESYSVRWSGKIRSDYSEEYTFYITRDNGVRLWIDNKLIVNKWDNHVSFDDTGKIYLEAGKFYDIKLEYFNNIGNGFIKLEWSSMSTGKTIVPTENLYPSEAQNYVSNLPGNGIGLSYEYFDEDNLTNFKEKGIDSVIDFNWGVGSPSKLIQQDQKFSIRWTGYIEAPYDGEYVFYVNYDDGAALWVDGQHLIDKWMANEINTAKSKAIYLKAGQKVPIMLWYRNTGLAGNVKLEWESDSIKRSVVPKNCLHPR